MVNVIATQHLGKVYGLRPAISGVNLHVGEGSLYGFLGPNGAGKTTTIRILLGFLKPSSGDAHVLDKDCWTRSSAIKKDVGYLSGDVRLYPWMNARRALRIISHVRRRDCMKHGRELAERLQLDETVIVRRMSRGMKQKLGLILALAHKPKLLVLDEPTTGLDPLMQDELATMLRERAENGCTVFFSSHTLGEVENLCEFVAIVRQGRIVADEPIESLRQRAQRHVQITFADTQSATSSPPRFLTVTERAGLRWACDMVGDAQPLVRWLATKSVQDLSIGKPDLEQVFRRFYVNEGPAK